MHGLKPNDGDRRIDWSHTSADYATHRPGFPPSFYERLARLGIAPPGSRVCDLATGTGALALGLARRGCRVDGIDIAAGQITQATAAARREALPARFCVAPAEATGLPAHDYDWVTAAQSWLYFDRDRAVAEVRRLLHDGGRLMTCHISWLALLDPVAIQTEALVLRHNPDWSAGGWDGNVPERPAWLGDDFEVDRAFVYDEPIPFTRPSWRGRIRACRGIGASLTPEQVEAFDREHAALLEHTLPERFTVLHRIDAHVLRPL